MKHFSLYFLLIIVLSNSHFSLAKGFAIQQSDDSLSYNANQSDTARLKYLIIEVRKYNNDKTNIDKARALIREAERLIESKGIEAPPLFYVARAEFFLTLRDFGKSLEQINWFYEKGNKNKVDIYTVTQFNNVSANYALLGGEYNSAIQIFKQNIDVATKNGIKGILPKSYEGLVKLFSAIKNKQEEKNSIELMLLSSIAENDTLYMYKAYMRNGFFSRNNEKEYAKAYAFFKKGVENAQKLNDTIKIVDATFAIAWNYYIQNKLDSSLNYYNEVLRYTLPTNNLVYISNAYGSIGTIYRDKKEYSKALDYYQKGIELGFKAKNWFDLSWMYKDISKMYEDNEDFEKAYRNYMLYKQYNDSIGVSTLNQRMADAKVKYEVQSKENELQLLSLKIKNQRLLIYGFVGLLILSVIITFLVIRQWKNNAKRRIVEMNQRISEITQANLRQQMNPHFVFNTLNSIQYYMYQNDKLSTNNYLTKFSNLMRKILENSQHTSVSLSDELSAVQLYLELESIRFKNKFDYKVTIDEEIDTLMYKIPTMLIQPYVENAICHGLIHRDEKGYLSIDIKFKTDYLSCVIVDNGIGREAAQEIRKKREENHQPLGTKITESRIDLINMLYGTSLKTIYSDLKDDNGIAIGTRVEIQIPILT